MCICLSSQQNVARVTFLHIFLSFLRSISALHSLHTVYKLNFLAQFSAIGPCLYIWPFLFFICTKCTSHPGTFLTHSCLCLCRPNLPGMSSSPLCHLMKKFYSSFKCHHVKCFPWHLPDKTALPLFLIPLFCFIFLHNTSQIA